MIDNDPTMRSIVNDYLSRLDNTKNSDKGNEIFRIYINAIVSIFFSKNYRQIADKFDFQAPYYFSSGHSYRLPYT